MTFEKAVKLEAADVTEENALAVIEALRGEKIGLKEAAMRYARRELAVKKDVQRKKDGQHAARFYLGDAAALPTGIRKEARTILDKVNEQRGIALEKHAAKVEKARKAEQKAAPKAKGPKVRKVTKADAGGAAVEI